VDATRPLTGVDAKVDADVRALAISASGENPLRPPIVG